MPRFYMARADGRAAVAAAGLYYYSPTASAGELREHVIGLDGTPRDLQVNVPAPVASPGSAGDGAALRSGDWIVGVPNTLPRAYLTMRQLSKGALGGLIREGMLHEGVLDGEACYALRPALYPSLVRLLEERRRLGYEQVGAGLRRLEVSGGPQERRLAANTTPFCDTLIKVGQRVSGLVATSLNTPGLPGGRLANPYLIFQLNRLLAERFVEGHVAVRLTESWGFDTSPHSQGEWAKALQRAEGRRGPLSFSQLTPEERVVFDLLLRGVEATVLPFATRLGKLPTSMELARAFTPGSGPAETIVFWAMHHPHWIVDMADALRILAWQGVHLDDGDIDALVEIFVEVIISSPYQLESWLFTLLKDLLRPAMVEVLTLIRDYAEETAPAPRPAVVAWVA